MILAAVFVVLAVLLVPTLRSYLHQQGQIHALRQQVAQQRTSVEQLQKEQARWKDNAYVEQQARERLKFVMPGDRSYTVLDADPGPRPSTSVAETRTSSKDHPWYGRLWESVQLADSPAHPGRSER